MVPRGPQNRVARIRYTFISLCSNIVEVRGAMVHHVVNLAPSFHPSRCSKDQAPKPPGVIITLRPEAGSPPCWSSVLWEGRRGWRRQGASSHSHPLARHSDTREARGSNLDKGSHLSSKELVRDSLAKMEKTKLRGHLGDIILVNTS